MKKTIVTAVIFAAAFIPSYARQGWPEKGKIDISLNISGAPVGLTDDDTYYYGENSDLASIYNPQTHNEIYTPVFSLMAEYMFGKRCSLGMEAAYSYSGSDYYDPFTDEYTGELSKHNICLMPGFKYRFLLVRNFSLHTGISAGASMQFGKDGAEDINGFKPAFQVVPVGFRAGSDFFVSLDLYLGNIVRGARFGIGYRF